MLPLGELEYLKFWTVNVALDQFGPIFVGPSQFMCRSHQNHLVLCALCSTSTYSECTKLHLKHMLMVTFTDIMLQIIKMLYYPVSCHLSDSGTVTLIVLCSLVFNFLKSRWHVTLLNGIISPNLKLIKQVLTLSTANTLYIMLHCDLLAWTPVMSFSSLDPSRAKNHDLAHCLWVSSK